MQHDEAHALLEAYSLGLLAEGQYDALEHHLDDCAECRARLLQLSEVAEAMADHLAQRKPSAEIEVQLMARVQGDRAASRPGPPSVRLRLGWMVAAAAVVGALLLGVRGLRLDSELARTQVQVDSLSTYVEKLRDDLAAYEDATFLLGEPGMQFIDMAGVEPNGQAFGKVVVDPQGHTGIVYMYQLPVTPEGMEYQLWVMHEGKPTSAGTFTVAKDGSALLSMKALPDLAQIASFEVTIEPAGGRTEPTGMMYLTGPNTLQFQR